MTRSTDPGLDFDPAHAQAVLKRRPDYDAFAEHDWDGDWMRLHFGGNEELGAPVRYERGGELSVQTVYPVLSDALIQASFRLQIDLIQELRSHYPSIPHESEWDVDESSLLRPLPAQ